MKDYLVTVEGKLFTIHRIVSAANVGEAARQVDQTGALKVWVEEAVYED